MAKLVARSVLVASLAAVNFTYLIHAIRLPALLIYSALLCSFTQREYLSQGSMRLSNLIPSIPANVVACLEVQGIRTDTDLLFSTTTFDIYKRLPAGTTTLEELTEYTSIAAEIGAAPGMSGHELLLLENTYGDVQLRTGNGELDDLLRGLDGRWIIELSGDKGSGKSVRLSEC